MGYYYVPTEKEFKKNPRMKGLSYQQMYGGDEFVCNICGKSVAGGECYYIDDVKNGKMTIHHVRCDTN